MTNSLYNMAPYKHGLFLQNTHNRQRTAYFMNSKSFLCAALARMSKLQGSKKDQLFVQNIGGSQYSRRYTAVQYNKFHTPL